MKNKKINISIIAAKFNEAITQRLLKACLEQLLRSGLKKNNIKVHWVPGSFEIPVAALKLARKKNIDCVICLGAVIRGETLHYDLVARGAAEGIMQVSLQTGKPVIFGVLTTETFDQASRRSQSKGENKGRDSAVAALEMIDLLRSI